MHVLISPRLRNKKHKSYNDSDYENSHGSDALLYMTTLCATTCLTSVQGQTSIKITWSESIYIYTHTYKEGWILKDLSSDCLVLYTFKTKKNHKKKQWIDTLIYIFYAQHLPHLHKTITDQKPTWYIYTWVDW